MKNLLVVEDEELERIHLTKSIKDTFGMNVHVFSASNGKDALDIILHKGIDIVLTDIELPNMSGLEVLEKVKQELQEASPIAIILTSYDYFEYAQKAMKYGVEDFVLKPTKMVLVNHAIQNALNVLEKELKEEKRTSRLIQKMNKVKPILEKDFIYSIIAKDSSTSILKKMSLLDYSCKEGFCFVSNELQKNDANVLKFIDACTQNNFYCICEHFYQTLVFFVFYNDKIQEKELTILNELIKTNFTNYKLGMGLIQNDVNEWYASYKNALDNLNKEVVVSDMKSLIEVNEDINKKIQQTCMALLTRYLKFNTSETRDIFTNFYQEITIKNVDEIESIMDQLVVELLRQTKQQFPTVALEVNLNSDKMIKNELYYRKIVFDILELVQEYQYKNTNVLVKKTIEYIAENYRKAINLADLAEYLEVTPSYISKLINQYSDLNFTELVSMYRIEESKKMLLENKKIKEIAYELGFQSQNYFAKVFKKFTGTTPKEYKNDLF